MGNGVSTFCSHIATKDQNAVVKKTELTDSANPETKEEPEVEGDVEKTQTDPQVLVDVSAREDLQPQQDQERQTPSTSPPMEDYGETNLNAYEGDLDEYATPFPFATIRRVDSYEETEEVTSEMTSNTSDLCRRNVDGERQELTEGHNAEPEKDPSPTQPAHLRRLLSHNPLPETPVPKGDSEAHESPYSSILSSEKIREHEDEEYTGVPENAKPSEHPAVLEFNNIPTKLPYVRTRASIVDSPLAVRVPGLSSQKAVQQEIISHDDGSSSVERLPSKQNLSPRAVIEQYSERYYEVHDASAAAIDETADASTTMCVCVEGDAYTATDLVAQIADRTLSEDVVQPQSPKKWRSLSLSSTAVNSKLETITESTKLPSFRRSQSVGMESLTSTPSVMLGKFLHLTEEDESEVSTTLQVDDSKTDSSTEQRRPSIQREYSEMHSLLGGPYAIDQNCEGRISTPSVDQRSSRRRVGKSASLNILSGDMRSLSSLSANKRLSEDNRCIRDGSPSGGRLQQQHSSRKQPRETGPQSQNRSLKLSNVLQLIGSQTCCAKGQTEIIPIEGPTFLRVLQSDDEFQILLDDDGNETLRDEDDTAVDQTEHGDQELLRKKMISSLMGDCLNNSSQAQPEFHHNSTDHSPERPPRPVHLGTMDKLLPRSILRDLNGCLSD